MAAAGAFHELAEHTGEVRVRVVAPDLAELYAEAARALGELQRGLPAPAGGTQETAEEKVEVAAPDRDALLVAWLNDLIYRAETRRRSLARVRVSRWTPRALAATVRWTVAAATRTPVKAATFHDLRIDDGPTGCTATFILDV